MRPLALYLARSIFKEVEAPHRPQCSAESWNLDIVDRFACLQRFTRLPTRRPNNTNDRLSSVHWVVLCVVVESAVRRLLEKWCWTQPLDVSWFALSKKAGSRCCAEAILLMEEWQSDLAMLGPQLGEGVAATIEETCLDMTMCLLTRSQLYLPVADGHRKSEIPEICWCLS